MDKSPISLLTEFTKFKLENEKIKKHVNAASDIYGNERRNWKY